MSVSLVFYWAVICLALSMFMALDRRIASRFGNAAQLYVRGAIIACIWVTMVVSVSGFAGFMKDEEPEISHYLRSTPTETLVAGLGSYIDSVPAYASRSVYVSRELLVPYKQNYYEQMADRVQTLHDIDTANSADEFKRLLSQTSIDYFVIENFGSTSRNIWSGSFPYVQQDHQAKLFRRTPQLVQKCTVLQGRRHRLVDARCLMQSDAFVGEAVESRR